MVVDHLCHYRNCCRYWFVLPRLPDFDRGRHLGIEPSGRMGLGYYELRFLDWYRSRRDTHLRDLVFAATEVAHVHQSLGRSDDAVCGDLRSHLSWRARRTCLDGVVSGAAPEQLRHLAELPQPSALGRVRRLDLLQRFGAVLVHRPCAGSRHAARPRDIYDQEVPLWCVRLRLARLHPQLAPL